MDEGDNRGGDKSVIFCDNKRNSVMKIKMSLAKSPVPYLTAGKEYELYGQEGSFIIYGDNKKKIFVRLKNCAHLDGADWELVPDSQSDSYCTFADLKTGEHFVLDGALGPEGYLSGVSASIFFKTALAGEAIVVRSKDSPCIIGAKASFWPDCPVRKTPVCFGV